MTDLYRQEDAQQILQIAIARQVESGELSRVQLFEIANELGISKVELQLAEQEWLTLKGEAQERQAFKLQQRTQFVQTLSKFAIVNLFLMVLNYIASSQLTWSLYIVLAWGLWIALKGWKTFYMQGDEYESAFQRWRRGRQLKKSVNRLLDRWIQAR